MKTTQKMNGKRPKQKWKTNQSTKINLIGCDTIVNSPSLFLFRWVGLVIESNPFLIFVKQNFFSSSTGQGGRLFGWHIKYAFGVWCLQTRPPNIDLLFMHSPFSASMYKKLPWVVDACRHGQLTSIGV